MATAPVPVLGPFQGQRTLQPGMRVRIGAHLVTVSRFLSSGGFAQVYLVEADVPVPIPGHEHRDTTLVLKHMCCLLYTSPSPRDGLLSRMPSSA